MTVPDESATRPTSKAVSICATAVAEQKIPKTVRNARVRAQVDVSRRQLIGDTAQVLIQEDIHNSDRHPTKDGLGLLVARCRIQNPEKHSSAGRLCDIPLLRFFGDENRINVREQTWVGDSQNPTPFLFTVNLELT